MMRGLGVYCEDNALLLLCEFSKGKQRKMVLAMSEDGVSFSLSAGKLSFLGKNGKPESIHSCSDFRITKIKNSYFCAYAKTTRGKAVLHGAVSEDFFSWKSLGVLSRNHETGMLVPDYFHHGMPVMFFGGSEICIAHSKDPGAWDDVSSPVLIPKKESGVSVKLEIGHTWISEHGIELVYYIKRTMGKRTSYAIASALFDRDNPERLLWKSETFPVPHAGLSATAEMHFIGSVVRHKHILYYWATQEGEIVVLPPPDYKRKGVHHAEATKHRKVRVERHKKNPIIVPIPQHGWESKATFNPAALYAGGRIHLLYRAIGDADMSVFGYASSADGIHFDERLKYPVYVPRETFEGARKRVVTTDPRSTLYLSGGGGWGGCEDPRLTEINGRVYLTYIAYDGGGPPRVALSSISLSDFLNKRWNWTMPVLMSPPGVVDKNACIFPEMINGKYVVLHRIFPNILIDFVDDLDFSSDTKWLKDAIAIRPRDGAWDSRKVGAGPPPIKTPKGWLLIYHAVGNADPGRYKIGAMLLDLKDPTKVIARSKSPILEPEEWYENEGWKYGVAYPCGAVVMKDTLYLYYGGADMVICCATAPLSQFLEHLIKGEDAQLEPVKIEGAPARRKRK